MMVEKSNRVWPVPGYICVILGGLLHADLRSVLYKEQQADGKLYFLWCFRHLDDLDTTMDRLRHHIHFKS